MLKAAAYVRVSTEDQTEYSPDAQLKAIFAFADKNDYSISGENIYTDAGISGRTAAKRPAFMQMITAAKKREFSVILVHKFDRFSRNRSESVAYKAALKKSNVKVISVTEHIEDDKFGIILESILESMAEYYSLNLAEEVIKGQTEKALRGELQTRPCYGYRVEKGNYIIIPNEAEYVVYIFKSFVLGKTFRQIAKELNDFGAVTKNGSPFCEDSVRYILKNPSYKGFSHWSCGGRTIIKKSTWLPIIDEKLWEEANKKLNSSIHVPNNSSQGKGILSSLIKCSCCGSSLVYTKQRKYLQCGGYNHGKCKKSHLISVKNAEENIYDELKRRKIAFPSEITDQTLKTLFDKIIFDKTNKKFIFYYKRE